MIENCVSQKYLEKYNNLLKKFNLQELDIHHDFNESDPTQYKRIIKLAIDQAIGLLTAKTPDNHTDELKQLVAHCKKWDKVYNHNARALYPELIELWDQYGY